MSTYRAYDPTLLHVEHLRPKQLNDEVTLVQYGGDSPTGMVGGTDSSVAQRFMLTTAVLTEGIRLKAGPDGISGNTQIYICAQPNGTGTLGYSPVVPNINLLPGEEILIRFRLKLPANKQLYLYVADRGSIEMAKWAGNTPTVRDGTISAHPTNGEQLYRGGVAAGNGTCLWFQILAGEMTYEWASMPGSSVTLAEDYSVSETGVLMLGQNTGTFNWSYYEGDAANTAPGLYPGQEVRVAYDGRELFSGIITDQHQTVEPDTEAIRRGFKGNGRITQSVTALHKWWATLQQVRYWDALDEDSAKNRLNRFGMSVSLNGENDAIAPEETGPNYEVDANGKVSGGTTLADIIRAFSEQVQRPVRLLDPNATGFDAVVQVVTDEEYLGLYYGLDVEDWQSMYRSVTLGHTAGAGRLDFSYDAILNTATADFVDDDVRLVYLAWRPPMGLPVPTSTPATVSRISRTFTSKQCSGNVEFHMPLLSEVAAVQAAVTRPRPALPWKPSKKQGLFVALAQSTAATSSDGTTWVERSTLPAGTTWDALTYGGGMFVATGQGYWAASSPDGATWTARAMPASATWYSVAYGDGKFVAVGNSTHAGTSPDGINWTAQTMPNSGYWMSVCYGNGQFVAVSYSSTMAATSPDGISWTQRTLPSNSGWKSVCYGNGMFVATDGGSPSTVAASSPDGVTWTTRTMPSPEYWYSVTFGNGMFVAVSGGGGISTVAASSPDGITWTARTMPSAGNWQSVIYGGGQFVAVDSNNSTAAAVSADGITWTARTLPLPANWTAVSYRTLP